MGMSVTFIIQSLLNIVSLTN